MTVGPITVRRGSSDPVKYLISRKYAFPFSKFVEVGSFVGPNDEQESLIAEMRAYEGELRAKPDDQIQALYTAEQERERDEIAKKKDLEERQLFFNQRSADADFEHWSKASYWTLDEAVALSFGKAPELVSWDRVSPYVNISDFAFQYARIRELAIRAKVAEQLFDPVFPGVFLAWAKRYEISYPAELEKQIIERGQPVLDWRSAYDELKAKYDESLKEFRLELSKRDAGIDVLMEQLSQLKDAVGRAEESLQGTNLSTKERESLLKLVIGMAVEQYNFDPRARRNEATKQSPTTLLPVAYHSIETQYSSSFEKAPSCSLRRPSKRRTRALIRIAKVRHEFG